MWDLINQLIDLNYPPDGLGEVLEWKDGFTLADIERRLTRFSETEAFKRLAGMGWPTLSSDLAPFRRLANINREIADRAQPQPELELRRLRQLAAEIQTLIDAEYR